METQVSNLEERETDFIENEMRRENVDTVRQRKRIRLFQIKGGGKKWRNKVWVDIKSKANDLHKNLLTSITDKVKKFNKDDDW